MDIHAGKTLLKYKTILSREPSMIKLINNIPLLESIVKDNYEIRNSKLFFNQTAVDLFDDAYHEYMLIKNQQKIQNKHARNVKSNAKNNPLNNPINNLKNNPINNPINNLKNNPINNLKNNPINNTQRDTIVRTAIYKIAPPIIMCSIPFINEETQSEVYLEMRGIRGDFEAENYFNTTQLEGFLGYSDIKHTLTSFVYDEDYVKLLTDVTKSPETFLTYEGFFKFINRSRKPNIIELKRLFKKIVFQTIFGSDEKKADISHVASDEINAVKITTYTYSQGCYRLDIGSVKQVFGENGILQKPNLFNYTDDQRVYKIGKANNIHTRLEQHRKTYFIKDVVQRHDASFVLVDSVKDRSYSLENKIFHLLENNKNIYKSTTDTDVNEIFILTDDQCKSMDDEILKITIKDLPPTTANEIKREKENLERTIENMENVIKSQDKLLQEKAKTINAKDESFKIAMTETRELLKEKDKLFQNVLTEKDESFQIVIKSKDESFQIVLKEKDKLIEAKDESFQNVLKEKDESFQIVIKSKDKLIEEKDESFQNVIKEKDKLIEAKDESFQNVIKAKDKLIEEKDISIIKIIELKDQVIELLQR